MTSALIVRKADAPSAHGIATVHVESWRTTYRGQVPYEFLDELSVLARTQFWERQIAQGKTGLFVAANGDSICGFINFGKHLDDDLDDLTGEVYAVYLLSEFQGAGIGRKLWTEATQELRQQGFAQCVVWVLDTNRLGIDFYERLGCRPDGAKKTATIGGKEVTELRYQVALR